MHLKLILLFLLISIQAFSQADIILHNGKIFTSDHNQLWVEALAIKGERILATGTSQEILKLKTSSTRLIDLNRKVVVPGFNDAHTHLGAEAPALRMSLGNDVTVPTPWPVVKDSLRSAVKRASPGTVIMLTIHPGLFEDPNARRKVLDSIAPAHPVVLNAWTGHGRILNSAALKYFAIDENAQVAGGNLTRDKSGKLDGVVEEYAGFRISEIMTRNLNDAKVVSDLTNVHKITASYGITTMQNMSSSFGAEQLKRIYSANQFACRIRNIAFPYPGKDSLSLAEWGPVLGSSNGSNYVSGIKIILDGTPIERLASMRESYGDRPAHYGRLNFRREELRRFFQFAINHNQQIMVHAVGDSAIVEVMRTMRAMYPDEFWKEKRLRLEHAEMAVVNEKDFDELKRLGIIIVQNPTHLALPVEMAQRIPKERAKYLQAMKSLLKHDIPLAIGSDGPLNPYLNIMLAVLHPDNPAEALNVEQAVIAYTLGSAFAEFKEREKGSLTKGKLADLAVLSQDIFSIPLPQLPATQSVMTMIGGKIVFDSQQ